MRFSVLVLFSLIFHSVLWMPVSQASVNPEIVSRVESYLRNLKTAKADFVQTAPNGRRLSGTFYLKRPGRLRFEYDGIKDFIVADGTFVYFYDSELESQSHAPIGQSPADFLLREDLSLTDNKDIAIGQAFETSEEIVITLSRKEDPQAGALTLFFKILGDSTIMLDEWIVKDARDNLTKVDLENFSADVSFDRNLFVYHDPKSGEPVYNK